MSGAASHRPSREALGALQLLLTLGTGRGWRAGFSSPGSPESPLSPAPARRGRSRPRRRQLTWAQRGQGAASGTRVERAGRGHHEQRRQHHLCQPQATQAGAENVSDGGQTLSAGAGGPHACHHPGAGSLTNALKKKKSRPCFRAPAPLQLGDLPWPRFVDSSDLASAALA